MAQHPVQTNKKQPAATKKKKNTSTKAAAASVSKIKVSTASERRGLKLAIKILQQALAAVKKGEIEDAWSGSAGCLDQEPADYVRTPELTWRDFSGRCVKPKKGVDLLGAEDIGLT